MNNFENSMENNEPCTHGRGFPRLLIKRIFLGLLLILVTISIVFGVYMLYRSIVQKEKDLLTGIPASAIMVVESKGIQSFLNNLSKNPLWEQGFREMGKREYLSVLAKDADRLYASGNREMRQLLEEQSFCMSLVPRKKLGPAFLFSVVMPRGVTPTVIHRQFKQSWRGYQEKRLLEIRFYEYVLPGGQPLYLTIRDGILLISADREVFELGYYTLVSGNHLGNNEGFVRAREKLSKSQNHSPRVYCSYEGYYSWLSRFMNPAGKRMISSIPFIGEWAALEMDMEDKGLRFQGFTDLVSADGEMGQFHSAPRQMADPGEHLPFNTVAYDQMSVTSLRSYQEQYVFNVLEKSGDGPFEYPVADTVKNDWMDGMDQSGVRSVTIAATDDQDTIFGGHFYLLLESKSEEKMRVVMNEVTDSVRSFEYQGVYVHYLSYPYLVPAVFGHRFHGFEQAYCFFLGGSWVFAPTERSVMSILNAISLSRTLASQSWYTEILSTLPREISRRYFLFTSPQGIFLKSLASENAVSSAEQLINHMSSVFMIAFVLEKDVLLMEASLMAPSRGNLQGGGGEALLDGLPVSEPALILDHRTQTKKVIVADDQGFLYLIDSNGNPEWKLAVKEMALSDLQVIDLYKNGRQQCLFMSKNMLHLISMDGKYVKGYPLLLPKAFQSDLVVFDYESNGNFRLLYRDAEGRLANIDMAGRNVAGWTRPSVLPLQRPIQLVRLSGTESLIVVDTTGAVHFLDRRGNQRFRWPSDVEIGRFSEVVAVRRSEGSSFAFLKPSGEWAMVSLSGACTVHEVLRSDPGSTMFMRAASPGEEAEIVVVSGGVISVFNHELKLLYRNDNTRLNRFKLVQLPDYRAALFGGMDEHGIPFLVQKPGLNVIQLSDKNFDHMMIWQELNGSMGYAALFKGALVRIIHL